MRVSYHMLISLKNTLDLMLVLTTHTKTHTHTHTHTQHMHYTRTSHRRTSHRRHRRHRLRGFPLRETGEKPSYGKKRAKNRDSLQESLWVNETFPESSRGNERHIAGKPYLQTIYKLRLTILTFQAAGPPIPPGPCPAKSKHH